MFLENLSGFPAEDERFGASPIKAGKAYRTERPGPGRLKQGKGRACKVLSCIFLLYMRHAEEKAGGCLSRPAVQGLAAACVYLKTNAGRDPGAPPGIFQQPARDAGVKFQL